MSQTVTVRIENGPLVNEYTVFLSHPEKAMDTCDISLCCILQWDLWLAKMCKNQKV